MAQGGMVFGRYYAGTSAVHRLDPRCKLTLVLAYLVIAICAATPAGLAVCVAFTIAFYLIARIPAGVACKAVLPLLPIVVLTAIANLFFVQGGADLVSWGFVRITENGAYLAVFMSVRLTALLFGACLVTLTTTSLDITDAFESMLKPFARFGLPAHELSMIAGIALRFLPQFAEELAYTRNAQASRGASLGQGKLRERVHALGALFIPLFTGVFRHAETLAAGMDARCYHGGPGRTRLHTLRFARRDAAAAAIVAAMAACIVACNLIA